MKELIKQQVEELYPELVRMRRHIHSHPELSFQEEKTATYVKSFLDKWGIPYTDGWAGHGVVGRIVGGQPGKLVALRGDMDALPIQEESEASYKSQHQGVMHACGHDVHTTCLLGAAKILQDNRDQLAGEVLLVFQPGEEKLPGGASIMLQEGLFSERKPDAMLGLHVHPPLDVGKVGVKPGMYMASADEIYLTAVGKGGHAALPQDFIDPILMAAKIVVALQEVVARKSPPTVPCVLSFGKINSDGGATNVIPERVRLEGTFRTMDEAWRKEAHRLIKHIAEKTAESMEGSCEVNIKVGYPYLHNNEDLTEWSFNAMKDYMGANHAVELPLRMTAEDFAYFSQETKACFFRLGTGNVERGITSPVHTPTFDIDEEALKVGVGIMSYLAMRYLKS